MTARDWQAFDAELRVRAPEIAAELLGKPSLRAGQEWRWGRKGSLAVVVTGAKAGMWFDHEAGTGGGLVDLVARTRGLSRRKALDWTADRIGLAGDVGPRRQPANRATRPAADIPETFTPADEAATPGAAAASGRGAPGPRGIIPISCASTSPPSGCASTPAATWSSRCRMPTAGCTRSSSSLATGRSDTWPAAPRPDTSAPSADRSALRRVPDLRGLGDGRQPARGDPACRWWRRWTRATSARSPSSCARRHPGAAITIVADNDAKPGSRRNPGVIAATKAARAIEARLAVPPVPATPTTWPTAAGPDAVAAMVAGRRLCASAGADLPRAGAHARGSARGARAGTGRRSWRRSRSTGRAVEAAKAAAEAVGLPPTRSTSTQPPVAVPPLLALPVDVGLGKSQRRRARPIAALLGIRRARPAQGRLRVSRATTSARSRSRRSARSACARCSGRAAPPRTRRRTIPSS